MIGGSDDSASDYQREKDDRWKYKNGTANTSGVEMREREMKKRS